ncbi:uncharacterized protein LOC134344354 isoform X2 [Mobula hypostoma]|uniref:uncharacterized protein LOC134344354 isoform X2 n=1 Tax=Mobula hypostoma TaxID=723540 RepID=UPI002FC34E8E
MDRDAVLLAQLLAFAVLGSNLLTPGLAANDLTNLHDQLQSNQSDEKIVRICNVTAMLEKVYLCGYLFENQLNEMNSSDWCNFTLIADYYSQALEEKARWGQREETRCCKLANGTDPERESETRGLRRGEETRTDSCGASGQPPCLVPGSRRGSMVERAPAVVHEVVELC